MSTLNSPIADKCPALNARGSVNRPAETHEKVDQNDPGDTGGIKSNYRQHPPNDIEKGTTSTALKEDDDQGDTIIADWDGSDDPEDPRNWSLRKKWASTVIISLFGFISPVSSSMMAPASISIAEEYGLTNSTVIAMLTSIFVLAYAFGPLLLSPLSEVFGRSIVLQLANLFYLAWNIGCGFAQNTGQMLAFRFLSGVGGSAPLSVGGGVIGDMFKPEERGKAIAIYALAPLLGPCIGPIAGAWVSERTSWRWVFYATSIADAVIQVAGIFLLNETYAPVLLERKAAKIRQERLVNNLEPKAVTTKYHNDTKHWKAFVSKSLVRPFVLFFNEPILVLFGLYMAFVYGLIYIALTTVDGIYVNIYHESIGIACLHYLALGLGMSVAAQLGARMLDKIYTLLKSRNDGVAKPEYRLPLTMLGAIILPIGLLLNGWTAQHHVFWLAPDLGLALLGAGMVLNFLAIQTYIIDVFTLYAASALAAVTCFRSLAGFGFPLFAPAMYKRLGYGKGDTILAAFAIAIGVPAPFLFWKYGERIRAMSHFATPTVAKNTSKSTEQ